MSLIEYRRKRDFTKTREPKGVSAKKSGHMFVIQKHHASHLHYDFRLELDGVLKSWAVPKGPSLDPKDKRLAMEVEDHPVSYGHFEGEIPKGEYGGGHVIVWDEGQWVPKGSAREGLKKGHLEFELKGHKLAGEWVLVRTRPSGKRSQWLLIKRNDDAARSHDDFDVIEEDKSVLSNVTLEQVEAEMGDGETDRPTVKAKRVKAAPKKAKASKVKKSPKIAVKSKLPGFVEPELATLVSEPPASPDWFHEIKFDGYRTMCRKDGASLKLLTRSGLDWTAKYSVLAKECKRLAAKSLIMDGEIVWLDEKGRSQFDGLQNALSTGDSGSLIYYVFDLLYIDGEDLRDLPLEERKERLKILVDETGSKKIIFSEHWDNHGEQVYQSACDMKLEGIISKDRTKPYESGRNQNWLKTKCKHLQEFVIGGFTLQDDSPQLAALLMGFYEPNGELRYIGKVGTGFNGRNTPILTKMLKKLESSESPYDIKSPREKGVHWVQPKLVANIEFGAWTEDQVLRHAAFKGLREDKDATEVHNEKPADLPRKKKSAARKAPSAPAASASKVNVKLSHPDKVLYPKEGLTKQDLADYYIDAQKWIMPHIKDRPLSLVRCPDGAGKECFFQKHVDKTANGVIGGKAFSKLKNKADELITIEEPTGLAGLVQLGTLELHAWGCHQDDIDTPDLIVFDLDPDPSVKFSDVKKAAVDLKKLLERLGLKSFIKVTGGKGLHLHVPIVRQYDFDQIKNFSKSVCQMLMESDPGKYTVNIMKNKRGGKIFLDYLRNGYGATAIVPYSARAKPNASIALPIRWEDLKTLKSADLFTLKNYKKVLKGRKDPWAGYFKLKQKIKIFEGE